MTMQQLTPVHPAIEKARNELGGARHRLAQAEQRFGDLEPTPVEIIDARQAVERAELNLRQVESAVRTRAFDGRGIRTEARTADGSHSSTGVYVCDPDGRWTEVWIDRDGNHAVLEGGLEGQQIVMVRRRPGSEEPDGRMVFADIGPSGFESRWEVPGADGGWTVANRARFTRR